MTHYPWNTNRRFNSYSDFFKKRFGERVQKLTIDSGFTCPNRDGTIGIGGCKYCNNDAFNPSYCKPEKSITQQLVEGIIFHQKRYRRASKYLAYFQPYSNTYASLAMLQRKFCEALVHPDVVGLVIGTRPDCIDDEKLNYLADLSKKKFVTVEYGIESCYEHTLRRINRGHSFQQSVDAIHKTAGFGIHVGAHLIFGLPGESIEEMAEEVRTLSKLPLSSIKFHQLQIIKGTTFEKEYIADPKAFSFFSLEEYLDFLLVFVEFLNPGFVIERITSEVPPRFLAGPSWGLLRNDQILTMFEKKLEKNNTWQGRLFDSGAMGF